MDEEKTNLPEEPADEEKINRPEEPEDKKEQRKERRKAHKFRRGFLFGLLSGVAAVILVIVIFLAALGLTPGHLLSAGTQAKIGVLSSIIDKYYYKDVSDSTKETGLYKGLLESMGDQYTEYYTPEEYQQLKVDLEGDYAGIGAVLTQDKTTKEVTVAEVYDDSPAKKAGLRSGDVIVSVDGHQAVDEDLDDFVKRVRGKKGTSMEVVYSRDGQEQTVSITREEVLVPSVSGKMLSDGIGYIRITQFSNGTQAEFEKTLKSLQDQGMKGVIFDLRDNGGGMVDSVVAILDDILPKGTVVYMKDKDGNRKNYTSDDEKQLDLPMTVLVNGNTASAAEIFTGAVMDFKKGTVIGTQTFGKGIVQVTLPLNDGSAVKITTARYYTPNGVCIQGKGITPDVTLDYEFLGSEDQDYDWTLDNQIQKAVEVLKETMK